MSTSFSFSRLGKLIRKQFYENVKFYTFGVLALVGLLSLVFAFWIEADGPKYHEEATWFIFLIGLFITGSVFASMSFNALGSKDKGIYWLSIPATHLEKLVSTIFYTTVVFTAVYCLCFFPIKAISVAILKGFGEKDPLISYTEMAGMNQGFGEVLPYFICAFFAVQALYLLGSVYFSRYSFVVTTVVGAFIIFVAGYYISTIDDNMFGKNISWQLLSARKYNPEKYNPELRNSYFLYSLSPAVTTTLKYLIQFAWAPLFWIVTWYRLKEKEI